MGRLQNAHLLAVSIMRGPRGLIASRPAARQPEKPIELYEYEACPYCRKVREVLSEMDLEYIARPCPRGGGSRDIVLERGGMAQFPYMIDPNTGTELYESELIISYLLDTYGNGRSLLGRVAAPLNTITSGLASVVRRRGHRARNAERQQPEKLLELYSFEASPFCRKVREALCELTLDYRVHNVAKHGSRRPRLLERGGKMMVPYLIDPNTGVEMYESDDIVAYLDTTYGAGTP